MASDAQRLKRLEVMIRQLQGGRHWVGDTSDPIAPSFQNSWVNYDGGAIPPTGAQRSASFTKRGGLVVLSGVIKTGASGTVAFVLPDGFRPAYDVQFVNFASATLGAVAVSATGNVVPANYVAGSNVSGFVFLDGIVFPAAA